MSTSDGRFARGEGDGLDRPVAAAAPDGISIVDDNDIAAHYMQLGLRSAGIQVLPRNFLAASKPVDFVFEQTTSVMQRLGRQSGVEVSVPGPSTFSEIHEKDAQVVAPTLVFAHEFLIEGGTALVFRLLEGLASYIKERRRSKASEKTAALDVIVTKGSKSKRVRYRGPIDGLPTVANVIETVFTNVEGKE